MLNVVKDNAMLSNKPKFNLNSTNASSSLELTSEIESAVLGQLNFEDSDEDT
jgi:hypothetical protein